MERDINALRNVCQIMTESDTLDALAEYWQEEMYETPDPKPIYVALRLAAKKKANAEPEIIDLVEEDEDEIFYTKWGIDAALEHRGPDRCLLGHALHRCKEVALLVLDDEDDS